MLGHVSGKGNQIISGSASKVISITVCFFCVIISYVLSRPIGIGNLFSISFNRSFTFFAVSVWVSVTGISLQQHCSSAWLTAPVPASVSSPLSCLLTPTLPSLCSPSPSLPPLPRRASSIATLACWSNAAAHKGLTQRGRGRSLLLRKCSKKADHCTFNLSTAGCFRESCL